MKCFCIKVLTVFLLGVPFFSRLQAFAADDVKNVAETIVKIYKLDSLANEYLFGSFVAIEVGPDASTGFTNNNKKSVSSGLKIRGLRSLHYKIDQNQYFDLKNDSLHYIFKFRF